MIEDGTPQRPITLTTRRRRTTLLGLDRGDWAKMLLPLAIAGVVGYFATRSMVDANADAIDRLEQSYLDTRMDVRKLETRINAAERDVSNLQLMLRQRETLSGIGETLSEIRDELVPKRRRRR